MSTYDAKSLKKVLTEHGYTPLSMSPEWCLFALQIVIAINTTGKTGHE